MRTPPSRGSSGRKSGHRRIADFLEEAMESDNESFTTAYGGFDDGILPAFLNDQSELVEVMLELDEESMVVRSVTPTNAAIYDAVQTPAGRSLSRCSSTSSRIRKKFAWLTSPSPCRSEKDSAGLMVMTARENRRIQARLNRTRAGAKRALKGLRFISRTTGSVEAAELWRRVEERFYQLSNEGLLSRENFGECIGMVDSKDFALGIFDALARRKGQNLERITKEELYDFWLQISDQSFDARLQIFFDMVDTNVDGRITREEVQELIVLSASANKLSKLKDQAEEYAALIMEELDPENLGYIELWQLEALLLQRDTYMNYSRPLSTASGANWSQNLGYNGNAIAGTSGQNNSRKLGSPEPKRRLIKGCGLFIRHTISKIRYAIEENWRRSWVILVWFLMMAALFVWKFTQYRHKTAFKVMGYCLPTAKGAAETLKLNMALVLLPVCRNTLTWLRSTWARFFVPFDDNITFHKMIATAIVVGITLHAGTHLACDFPHVINSTPEQYHLVEPDFGPIKPTYTSFLTGIEGITGITMVILMTISFTLATHPFRKNGEKLPFPLNRLSGFNAFWYSHHLLGLAYALLLVHGYFMSLVHKWYERTVRILDQWFIYF